MRLNLAGFCAVTLTAAAFAACTGSDPGADAESAGESATVAHASAVVGAASSDVAPADTLVVYKSPTCGCCSKWVDHVRENGFAVVTHDVDDPSELNAKKQELGVPVGRASCHTATIAGYTIEGHVPADLIQKLLSESPRGVKGLAVPGMPAGSPGMEGWRTEEYDVLAFDSAGSVSVYARR
ncbi:MAG TPA: DUF411 domain-containing protein [Longimicrobiales bacterium]|nr:DUF411 domain-containing protein [Longimicrobiales bacterium]